MKYVTDTRRALFKDVKFATLFIAGSIATFPLLVPPFFLPLYANSIGLSASAGAGLVAGFNFSSAIGRLCCGLLSDSIGPVNTLFISLLVSALSMLGVWPVSSSLGPLIFFVIVNGMANGGFFSTMPTVVTSVFGSKRVGVAMGMIVTGWAGGYLMVRQLSYPKTSFVSKVRLTREKHLGSPDRWISLGSVWWGAQYVECVSSGHVLRRINGSWRCWSCRRGENNAQ